MSNFGARLMTGGILAAIGLITVKLVIALVSGIAAFFSFLLFTVLPIVVIGWLVYRAFRYLAKDKADKPAYD